ncbi:MAG TPA: pseudouridine synthase [Anaerolineaceae bacterium]|uniref:Pseudouridine synthase n=1 Tax=Anaerolinea thermophila TaxID=167964 RepID=A0A101FYT3_9CHLR|nr:MAG: Pseudouridine synthase [Anaerolinea thermophila]HAF61623.1 pseudouridine synthase [Anaerolineaceae bacterium]
MEERLQKILSRYGYGSRRESEKLIQDRKVSVNGKIAELGQKADIERDAIKVGSRLLQPTQQKMIYIAFHKPRGVLSDIVKTREEKIVRDYIDIPEHIFIVGRLDKDSEGLMLLTNDGNLANILTHPRYQHEKEYQVLLNRTPDEKQLNAWRNGVVLEDGSRTGKAKIDILRIDVKGCWVNVTLKEGRKRQIRETAARIGLYVKRIIRVRISTLELGNLPKGKWRYLTEKEIKELKS